MIQIINYGMGNVRSVQKIFQRLKVQPLITNDKDELMKATKLVLPGVGHFANGMSKLKEYKLIDTLNYLVLEKKVPVLGICMGMQLMTSYSEEGDVSGLNWIEGSTKRFSLQNNQSLYKIPHMGWNNVTPMYDNPMTIGISHLDFFYFVHSYYVTCVNPTDVMFKTTYMHDFVSGFSRGNIYGTQFHPEKSHKSGLKLIQNFINL